MRDVLAALYIATSVLLSGCATRYGERGWSGGYESNWLAPDILSVAVAGNGFTSDAVVKKYALLQAAERAQQAGYKYFTIVKNDNTGNLEEFYTPTMSTTTTTGNIYGNTLYATSNTTSTGGIQDVYKPSREMVVKLYKEPPVGYSSSQYYDVQNIIDTIGVKYLKKKG